MVKGQGNLSCVKCGTSTGRDSQVSQRDFYCDKCWLELKGKKTEKCPLCQGKGFVVK